MYVLTIDQRRSRTSADRVPALLDALNEIPVAAAFERTASRLIEMQSAEYLATAHRG